MTDGQGEGLETARALFEARNIEGAKRILGQLLEEDPDSYGPTELMASVLLKENKAKEALDFCNNWIARHPNFAQMHIHRFAALAALGRKKEMAATLGKFQKTFPHFEGAIASMELLLAAKKGQQNVVRKRLEEELGDTTSPDLIRLKGLALHRIDDLFEADYYLSQAVEHYPNDAEVLSAMATNQFQLGRLASARKFASQSLAIDPTRRRMAFLSRATWLFYYPSFYIFLMFVSVGGFLWSRINRFISIALFAILFVFARDAIVLLTLPIFVLFGISFPNDITLLLVIVISIYMIAVIDQFYQRIFGAKKTVRLKKY